MNINKRQKTTSPSHMNRILLSIASLSWILQASHASRRSAARSVSFYSDSSTTTTSDSITAILDAEDGEQSSSFSSTTFFSPSEDVAVVFVRYDNELTVADVDAFQSLVLDFEATDEHLAEAEDDYSDAKAIYNRLYSRPAHHEDDDIGSPDIFDNAILQEEEIIQDMKEAQEEALTSLKLLIRELRAKRLDIIERIKELTLDRVGIFEGYFRQQEDKLSLKLHHTSRRRHPERYARVAGRLSRTEKNLIVIREILI